VEAEVAVLLLITAQAEVEEARVVQVL